MKNKEPSPNRKALPKFLAVVLISALVGGLVGGAAAFVGATTLPQAIVDSIYAFLKVIAPWSVLIPSTIFLSIELILYGRAKKITAHWDGENQETIYKAKESLAWAMLLTNLNFVTNLFFMGASLTVLSADLSSSYEMLLVTCLLSFVCITLLQQKAVDLSRKIDPTKQDSIYDRNFQKKWMENCNESQWLLIGQAAYKALNAIHRTCMALWLILIVLYFTVGVTVLPFFLVTLIMGVSNLVFGLESIRLARHKQ